MDQNPRSVTPEELINQTVRFEADFTLIAIKLKEVKLSNVPRSETDSIVQKITSIENKGKHIQQQQQQLHHNMMTVFFWKILVPR